MQKSLQELIAATSELRALPSTTMRLLDLLDDDTVEAGRVLDVIEKDPSLTANLLKLCNSAYYGLRRKVGSAREALVLLGNQTIVTLAFATSMGDVMRGPLGAYHMARNEMWHHALGTALGAAHLASLDGGKELRERAFTGGLVHDIGKLILNRPLREHLEQLPPDCDFAGLREAEKSILGFDHAEAGGHLGEAWNFPDSLVRIIRLHHEPAKAGEEAALARAVAAANLICCRLGYGGGTGPVSEEDFWSGMEPLEFPEDAVETVLVDLPRSLQDTVGLIGESL